VAPSRLYPIRDKRYGELGFCAVRNLHPEQPFRPENIETKGWSHNLEEIKRSQKA